MVAWPGGIGLVNAFQGGGNRARSFFIYKDDEAGFQDETAPRGMTGMAEHEIEWLNPKELREHPFSTDIYGRDRQDDLVDSISKHGILMPLVVHGDNVVSGNRRLRAALELGLESVPCIRRSYDGELEEHEAILEHNRYRAKTGLQLYREGRALEEIERKKAKQRQSLGGQEKVVQHVAQPEMERKTRTLIARAIGLGSGEQWRRLDYVAKRKPGLLARIGQSGLSISKAYIQAKEEEIRQVQLMRSVEMVDEKGFPILRYGSFLELADEVPDNSVSLIMTSIRCDAGSWPDRRQMWENLSLLASHVLVQGGFLIGYGEKMHLPEIMHVLNKHLTYFWTAAFLLPHWDYWREVPQKTVTNWRPIIIYSKGKLDSYAVDSWRDTMVASEGVGSERLEATTIARYFVRIFSAPGTPVLDPCAGSGTFLAAALMEGRRAFGYESNPLRYQAGISRLLRLVVKVGIDCPRKGCSGKLFQDGNEGDEIYRLNCGYRVSVGSGIHPERVDVV